MGGSNGSSDRDRAIEFEEDRLREIAEDRLPRR